jgi:hypothetical protein
MEGAIRVAAGTGIRVQPEKKDNLAHFVRKWAFIDGQRSVGRFTVVSSANQANYQGTVFCSSSFRSVITAPGWRSCGLVLSLVS